MKCFGRDAIDAAFNNKSGSSTPNGSIFAAFARRGQAPVMTSYRAITADEIRYDFALCLTVKLSDLL